METVYRGTQRQTAAGVRKGQSWAYSLPVALIWSAQPGDPWAGSRERREPQFLSTSTIHVAQANVRNPLSLSEKTFTSLGNVLRILHYEEPNGITEDEVRRVYNYLHNRITGKAKGGDFSYSVIDADGDEIEEADVPLSFLVPQSMISLARDDWDFESDVEVADRLRADTFIFADAPSVQQAALRLGYDALTYLDVFTGGTKAAEVLLDTDIEDLDGIEMEYDLENKQVPTHWTLRPLSLTVIVDVTQVPIEVMLAQWSGEAVLGWY